MNTKKTKTQIKPIANKQTNKFNWENIFNNDVVKTLINNLTIALEQLVENENKKLKNQIELRNLDIEEQKLYLESDKQERTHSKNSDIRGKIYDFVLLIVIVGIAIILSFYNILDKNEIKVIVFLTIGYIIKSNIASAKKLFGRKSN